MISKILESPRYQKLTEKEKKEMMLYLSDYKKSARNFTNAETLSYVLRHHDENTINNTLLNTSDLQNLAFIRLKLPVLEKDIKEFLERYARVEKQEDSIIFLLLKKYDPIFNEVIQLVSDIKNKENQKKLLDFFQSYVFYSEIQKNLLTHLNKIFSDFSKNLTESQLMIKLTEFIKTYHDLMNEYVSATQKEFFDKIDKIYIDSLPVSFDEKRKNKNTRWDALTIYHSHLKKFDSMLNDIKKESFLHAVQLLSSCEEEIYQKLNQKEFKAVETLLIICTESLFKMPHAISNPVERKNSYLNMIAFILQNPDLALSTIPVSQKISHNQLQLETWLRRVLIDKVTELPDNLITLVDEYIADSDLKIKPDSRVTSTSTSLFHRLFGFLRSHENTHEVRSSAQITSPGEKPK